MNEYRWNDTVTVGPAEDIRFYLPDSRPTLTVGELRRHLAKFPASQKIYFQGEDGDLEEIRYAELHEWGKR